MFNKIDVHRLTFFGVHFIVKMKPNDSIVFRVQVIFRFHVFFLRSGPTSKTCFSDVYQVKSTIWLAKNVLSSNMLRKTAFYYYYDLSIRQIFKNYCPKDIFSSVRSLRLFSCACPCSQKKYIVSYFKNFLFHLRSKEIFPGKKIKAND